MKGKIKKYHEKYHTHTHTLSPRKLEIIRDAVNYYHRPLLVFSVRSRRKREIEVTRQLPFSRASPERATCLIITIIESDRARWSLLLDKERRGPAVKRGITVTASVSRALRRQAEQVNDSGAIKPRATTRLSRNDLRPSSRRACTHDDRQRDARVSLSLVPLMNCVSVFRRERRPNVVAKEEDRHRPRWWWANERQLRNLRRMIRNNPLLLVSERTNASERVGRGRVRRHAKITAGLPQGI